MTIQLMRRSALPLLLVDLLFFAGCATNGADSEGAEPVVVGDESLTREEQKILAQDSLAPEKAAPTRDEGEVPIAVAESEPPVDVSPTKLPEVIVAGRVPERHEVISIHVSEARELLRDVELEYVFTGKGKGEVLRGRPVVFALWSEA